ncbi:MAG: fused MFS/spermidine synthase [Patescibacteria group bacterium]
MVFHEQSFEIKTLLFISGFAILSLEILGIRILAPYVGTTVSVWAALSGVTLAGSSVGYYGGGVFADYTQKKAVFLWLVAGASISIALIPLLRSALSVVAPYFGYSGGALMGAMLLFFVPTMFLSATTTYIIRIFVKNLDTIGQVHGDLYALATIGSVAGVFGTSYILVPFFTIPHILYGLTSLIFLLSFSIFLSPSLERGHRHS